MSLDRSGLWVFGLGPCKAPNKLLLGPPTNCCWGPGGPGNLFFVVPVGEPTIQFNAHRIYSRDQILSYFKELKLEKFTLIGEQFSQGGLIDNPSNELLQKQKYGCGCFWFKKI